MEEAKIAGRLAWSRGFLRQNVCTDKDAASFDFGVFVVDEDVDPFDASEMAADLGVDPGDRFKLARPVGTVVWPRDPGGLVRLPLGRHAIAKCGRRLGERSSEFLRHRRPESDYQFRSPISRG